MFMVAHNKKYISTSQLLFYKMQTEFCKPNSSFINQPAKFSMPKEKLTDDDYHLRKRKEKVSRKGSSSFNQRMELSEICGNLVRALRAHNNSVKDFREKTAEIRNFREILQQRKDIQTQFINSTYIVDIICAILDISIVATEKDMFQFKKFEEVPNFFAYLANNNISFAKDESGILPIINLIRDIIGIHIPKDKNETWKFWLIVFTQLIQIPTFFNIFKLDESEDQENYANSDELFKMINGLMKFHKLTKEENAEYLSLALNFFRTFLLESPYPPFDETIFDVFSLSDKLANVNLKNQDFITFLGILNNLISISPISFLINATSANSAPFNKNILRRIFEQWDRYQSKSDVRKSSSEYLLLFLTTTDAMKCPVDKSFVNNWTKRLLDVWASVLHSEQIFPSLDDIPYFRLDVELFKRSNNDSISLTLLNYILPNNKLKFNTNIFWLFSAIGMYAPEIIHQNHWLKILEHIPDEEIFKIAFLKQRAVNDFYHLIYIMVDIIDSIPHWNKIFVFLCNKIQLRQIATSHYKLMSKILSCQRIDTKVARENQFILWKDKADQKLFSLGRLKCIHTMIYYYGFLDDQERNKCFMTLLAIFDATEQFHPDYLRQLSLTLSSVFLPYACELIQEPLQPIKEDSIEDICNRLSKTLEITISQEKEPLQTEEIFSLTPESSQAIDDDGLLSLEILPFDDVNYGDIDHASKKKQAHAICNFISSSMQASFVSAIRNKKIPVIQNKYLLNLYLTSAFEKVFPPSLYLEEFKNRFLEDCTPDNFSSYLEILLEITENFQNEELKTFFEDLNPTLLEMASQFIKICDGKINEHIQNASSLSWDFFGNISFENFFNDLPLLAHLAINCSKICFGSTESFYSIFEDFLSTSEWIPILHLNICSFLLKMDLCEQQFSDIIRSLERITIRVLQTLLVPIKERNQFISQLFQIIPYNNSQPLAELFESISKISITPDMRLALLNVIEHNYQYSNVIFDCFWTNSAFFVNDEYTTVRLKSIDVIISILKLNELTIVEEGQPVVVQLIPRGFAKKFILEGLITVLDEVDWLQIKPHVFTALKTLIEIAANIPQLSIRYLMILFKTFINHKLSIFPNQCLSVLFSGLSSRVHFSVLLRQFIPLLVPHLNRLGETFDTFPFPLFFMDEIYVDPDNKFQFNERKRLFCDEAQCYAIPYAIAHFTQPMIDFYAETFKLKQKDLYRENAQNIYAYLIEVINDIDDDETNDKISEIIEYLNKTQIIKFDSPLPLLRFVDMTSEESISESFSIIALKDKYLETFFDIRGIIHILYKNIFEAHHCLVQTFYMKQFFIYLSTCFDNDKGKFETTPTLYSDVLSLSVNLLEFISSDLSSNIILLISQNIPESFRGTEMVGFIKDIEDLCSYLPNHPSIELFLERFPDLIDKILIIDFLKESQIERRTPLMEFERIAMTRRLNINSIDFLLRHFIVNDSEFIDPILSLDNDYQRVVLNEIYQFSLLNPQSNALHLYSEMYLHFFHIHPSPQIISPHINSKHHLFELILMLSRDKNPSISRSALTTLYQLNQESLIEQIIPNHDPLYEQLIQYSKYNHPRKNLKKPESNSPWVCKFSFHIMENLPKDTICHYFASLAAQSVEFAEYAFPHMFVQSLDDPNLFSKIWTHFQTFAADPKLYSKECRIMLTSFHYLKKNWFKGSHKGSDWHLKWADIHIDFELLMKTSLQIGDPYSAYQYAEFAHESVKMDERPLKEIFTQLGVKDLKNGLLNTIDDSFSIAEMYEQDGKIGHALSIYDILNNKAEMKKSLGHLHLYNLLNTIASNNFDSLWKLRQWKCSSEMINQDGYSLNLYRVMQAFASKQEQVQISNQLNQFQRKFSFDTSMSVFDQLSSLLNVSALQWFQAILFPHSNQLLDLFSDNEQCYQNVFNKLNKLTKDNYEICESTNMLYAVFFSLFDLPNNLPRKFFQNIINNGRENNQIESAQYFISILNEKSLKIANFEQIQLLYRNNPQRAYSLLSQNSDKIILNQNEIITTSDQEYNLRIQFTKASWGAYIHYLSREEIHNLINEVIDQSGGIDAIDLMAEAEFFLGKYYHRLHQEVCDFFKSSEYSTIMKNIENTNALTNNQIRKSATMKSSEAAQHEYETQILDNQRLFCQSIVNAISNYMKCLIHSDTYDLESTFSIIGLWFDYSYAEFKPFIQEVPDLIPVMEEYFDEINATKFVSLFYQLAARVDDIGEISSTQSNDYNSAFQNFLKTMVKSISQKCPMDCFPILHALMNNDRTQSPMQTVDKKKIDAIKAIVYSIVYSSDELKQMWKENKLLLNTYIRFGESPNMTKSHPSCTKLSQFGAKYMLDINAESMPFATIVTSSRNVAISHFEDKISILNGVTKPILLNIVGTDGHLYKQILKANKDDLRQDAVMQQLFILASTLLSHKNHDFSIRHYKVVPLSPTVGLIEFVENSISIQDYIWTMNTNKSDGGAITRYYTDGPNASMNFREALSRFATESTKYHKQPKPQDKDLKALVKCFEDIRSKLKPVFKFFFIEKFQNSADWFVSRLRYAQHCATNSIVGHILGIGDRHLNNILIDVTTGEVIHIDLGIAFGQGKALPIIERVPFRLTNEIIDGMGWMGKEGIFRPACETSMKVLRNNQEYLLTILKVLMCDPLYNWVIVPPKNKEKHALRSSNENKNQYAENVIFECKRKLEGRETGEMLSVEGQVARLINDATNVENLALMFHGWKPIL